MSVSSRKNGAGPNGARANGDLANSAGPNGDLARYRSRWRSALRLVVMRILFRALVVSQVSVRAVRSPLLNDIDGGFVLVANHSSHLDAPVVMQNLPTRLARYVATGVATDYFYSRLAPKLFTRLVFNAYPIDRDRSGTHTGLSGRLLEAGIPLLVFPEATRSRARSMRKFTSGATALAMAHEVPVVPVALVGTFEAMPKGRSWPVPGRLPVIVVYGDPMWRAPGESRNDFTCRIQQTVAGLYTQHHPAGAALDFPGDAADPDAGEPDVDDHPPAKES